MKTYWKYLDSLFEGFMPGKTYCIAATNAMGKYCFATSLCNSINNSEQGSAILVSLIEPYQDVERKIREHNHKVVFAGDVKYPANSRECYEHTKKLIALAKTLDFTLVIVCHLDWNDFEWADTIGEEYYTLPADMPYYTELSPHIETFFVLCRPEVYGVKKWCGLSCDALVQILIIKQNFAEQLSSVAYYLYDERKIFDKKEYETIKSKLVLQRMRSKSKVLSNLIDTLGLEPYDMSEATYFCSRHAAGQDYTDGYGGHYSMDKKIFRYYDQPEDCVLQEYHIMDGTEIVNSNLGMSGVHVGTLAIPKSVRKIHSGNIGRIEQIDNIVMLSPYYKCCDGLVLTSDGKTVVSHYGNYNHITIPDGVEKIQPWALCDCKATSISVPQSVKFVDDFAFHRCQNLKSITMLGIEVLGEGAFDACHHLETVTLSSNVLNIGAMAFDNTTVQTIRFVDCDGVESDDSYYKIITVDAHDAETGKTYANRFLCDESGGLLHYLDNNPVVEVPDGITIIHEEAFHDKCELKSVFIPDSVRSIREEAFSDCHKLEHVQLPNGLRRLTRGMFANCESLKSLTLPQTLKKIESYVFNNYYGNYCPIDHLTLPEGLLHISSFAFADTKIERIEIPSSVIHVDKDAFNDSYIYDVIYKSLPV